MRARRSSGRRRKKKKRRHQKKSPTRLRIAMAIQHKTLKLCNCNKTLPLDAQALGGALQLGAAPAVHTELCRKQAASFQGSLGDAELLVGCTQEAPLFSELADSAGSKAQIRFVNL